MEEGEIVDQEEWYEDTVFKTFWKNYTIANEWIRSHGVEPIVGNLTGTVSPGGLVELGNVSMDTSRLQEDEELVEDVTEEEIVSKEDIVSEEDIVSKEYLEFVAQTRRHQKERERLRARKSKKKRGKNNEPVYQNITSVDSVFERSEAPTRESGSDNSMLRKLQMQQWYGSRSEEIESLEASIQADYDQFIESRSPSFWPETPLRMDIYFKK